jgi:hypothetical protein
MYQRPLGLGAMVPQIGALPTAAGQVPGISPLSKAGQVPGISPLSKAGQVPGISPLSKAGQVPGISPLSKAAPVGATPWAQPAPIGATPWAKPVPAVAPAACSTMYGPVANVCQSAVPVTQQVPVTTQLPDTTQVPITTVTPIPTGITPQVYAAPTPGLGAYGAGIAPTAGVAPWSKAPLRPGAYSTEAASIL